MPAKGFVETLSEGDQRKLAALLQHMADIGRINNTERFRKVDGDIWEFKRDWMRLLCFQRGNSWVLTHGYKKQSRKLPTEELRRAEQIMKACRTQ